MKLLISPAKSTASLLTRETKQINRLKSPNQQELRIFIDGEQIPTVVNPKILGVTLDPSLKFHQHVEDINRRVRKNTNVLKVLASTAFGQSKESMLTTYKAIGRSLCDYAAPVWAPSTSNTSFRIRKLQVAQNGALRVALGCHKAASIDHLHGEAKMLKVEEHCNMLTVQYLAACHEPGHPCEELREGHTGPLRGRSQFQSLLLKHHQWIQPRLVFDPGGTGEVDIARTRAALHKICVGESLRNRQFNRVLGERPPRIHPSERVLPRQARCLLSQLRSGHSISLRSYQHVINPRIPDICPLCGIGPHDTQHIFNCRHRRTALEVRDLWRRPLNAYNFVKYLHES